MSLPKKKKSKKLKESRSKGKRKKKEVRGLAWRPWRLPRPSGGGVPRPARVRSSVLSGERGQRSKTGLKCAVSLSRVQGSLILPLVLATWGPRTPPRGRTHVPA